MKILAYAFTYTKHQNISQEVLRLLPFEQKFFIDCTTNASALADMNKLANIIYSEKPDYVLGLGEYGGIDQQVLRIETIAKNKFRNNTIGAEDEFSISQAILPKADLQNFKITHAMGNSFCNLSTYKVSELIAREKMPTKLTFIHIPRSYDIKLAAREISKLVDQL